MTDPTWAAATARALLEDPLPRRWAHTQGVAARAATLAGVLGEHADLIASAAWLHDIGYSPAIVATGFHPLDGARHLRDHAGACDLLCRLVAYHSGALAGAAELGLADTLAEEFSPPPPGLDDALTYCDMTTSPDGEPLTITDRLADILSRYGPGDPVSRAITAAAPDLTAAVARVTARLASARPAPGPR